MVDWGRKEIMRHFLVGENVGLVFKFGNPEENSASIHVTKHITDFRSWSRPGMQGGDYVAPLYLYPDSTDDQLDTLDDSKGRTPNLNKEMVLSIAQRLGLTFVAEKEGTTDTFAPIDILDYIYAVLHSPAYRQQYREFLKIDFPRVPYPTDAAMFWRLVEHGRTLRTIHLLENPIVGQFQTTFPNDGDNRCR